MSGKRERALKTVTAWTREVLWRTLAAGKNLPGANKGEVEQTSYCFQRLLASPNFMIDVLSQLLYLTS